ncbi:MAG: ATP-binding protein [Planctomycetota bacterium]
MALPKPLKSHPLYFCALLAKIAAAGAILGGTLSFFVPAFASPHPLVPLALLLAGLSLALTAKEGASPRRRRASEAFAALVAVLGLIETFNLLWFLHPHGDAATPFEFALVLLGLALLLLDRGRNKGRWSQSLALGSATITLLALLGSLYLVDTPYLISKGMNAPPAMAFVWLLLSAGALCARPNRGWMIVLTDTGTAGRMARPLLSAAVLVPIILGYLKVLLCQAGSSGAGLGPIMVLALILLFMALIWLSADSVLAQEQARGLAEQSLRETREHLQAIADNTTSVICLKDLSGRFLLGNRQFERVSGKSSKEFLGKTSHDIFPQVIADRLHANDLKALATGSAIEVEETIPAVPSGGGEQTYASVKFPILDASGRPHALGMVAVNITQRKNLENQLQQAQQKLQNMVLEKTSKLEETGAQLMQAQKMEAVGRLAGGVAHDFNNLLCAISGFSELLLGDMDPQDPRRTDVQEIQKAGARATTLTRQLLAFSRRQVLQPSTLELNPLVAGVLKMLKRLIGEDIDFAFIPGDGVGMIYADASQVEQVLMNLAVNARDAMPQGGKLTLSTEMVALDQAFVRENPGSRPGPHAMLAVADTGCGMDANVLSHLFEPFFTTKVVGKGTGLGLSTVYGIVKQSGAYIAVESAVGKGTTFRVYFPEVKGDEAANKPESSSEALAGTETVLVVEDDDGVRKPIMRLLLQNGYKALEASGPEDALLLAQRHPGPIDLLLTDVVMPKMRGYELAKLLAASRPKMKIIYMTGYVEDSSAALESGPKGFTLLLKPIPLQLLARTLRETLDR